MMCDYAVRTVISFLWIFLAIDCSNRSAECTRAAGDIFVNYREILKSKLNQLKSESRYRTFIELERQNRLASACAVEQPRRAKRCRYLVFKRLSWHGAKPGCGQSFDRRH
jgi:hypothetical protein